MSGRKPSRIKINGEDYRVVVLKVLGRDELGRPRQCELMYEGESTKIEGGEDFLVVFAKSNTIAARHN
jgi:hypothetical protein